MSKRSESAKKIGRKVKERGHAYENVFNTIFYRKADLNFSGSSNDCWVDEDTQQKLSKLKVRGNKVSLKAADTWQFHLGNMPELSDTNHYKKSLVRKIPNGRTKLQTCGTHSKSFEEQLRILKSYSFWEKYLGGDKGDYLCYTNRKGLWRFFSMRDVINFITNNAEWRLLPTGRIKGDFLIFFSENQKTITHKAKGILTFEFRDEDHKQTFVLGAHCGKNGKKFMEILSVNIPFVDLFPD